MPDIFPIIHGISTHVAVHTITGAITTLEVFQKSNKQQNH